MNTDVCVSNVALDAHLHAGRRGKRELRLNGVHRRWCGAHERESHNVLSGIAPLQMRRPVVGMARRSVVLMGGQPVVMFGVFVILVGVHVQQRRDARRRHQRRNEQQRQGAVHTVSV